MIKMMSSFAVMAALVSGAYPFAAHSVTPRLIVPGKSVGKMSLGLNERATLSRFGRPDAYDAGMSQTWQAWVGKGKDRSTLFVHTIENGAIDAKPTQGLSVDAIRTSSRRFRTASGIGVGSSLKQIRHAFSHLRRLPDADGSALYADVGRGIGFAGGGRGARCVGVTVFAPGKGKVVTAGAVLRLLRSAAKPSRARFQAPTPHLVFLV